MARANWGTKRRCLHCGAPFYDLNRTPIHCPKCEAEFRPEAVARPPARASRAAARMPPPPPEPVDAEAFEEDEVLLHDEDGEDEETILTGEDGDEGDEMRE